ncbi:hypothetical protein ISCGN_009412 [Ixodes scapularis]
MLAMSGQDGSSSFTMLKRVFIFVQISLLPFGNLDVISAASDEQFQDRIVVTSSDVTSTVYCADAQSSPIPKTVPCDNDNGGHVFTGYSATPTGMTMVHIDGIKSFGQGFDASGQDGSSSFTMLKRVFFFVQISLLPFGNLDVISAASDEQFQDRIVVISSDVTSTVYCADAQSSPIPKTVPCDNDNRGHVFTGYSATPTGMTMAHIDGIKSFGQGFDASGQDGSSSFTMLKRVFLFVQISLLPFGNLDVISAASDEQFQDRIVVISSDVTSTVYCAHAQSSPIPKTAPCDDNRGHVFTGYSATPTGMTMAHIDDIKSFGQGFDASGQDGSSSFTMLKRVFFFVQISLLPFGNLDVISAASDEQFQDRIVVISSDVTSTVYCADAESSPIPKTVPCDNDNRGHVFTGYSATPTGMTMAHIDGIKSFGQGFDASGQDGSSSFTMLKRVFFFVQISLLPFGNLDVISAASDEQFQDRIVVISSDVTSTVNCADAQSSPIPKTVPCDNDNRGHVFTGYSAMPTGMTMAHIDDIKSFGQGFDASGQNGSSSFTMLKRVFFFVQISLLPFGNLDVISAASDEQFQDRIVVISSDVTSTVNCADAQSSPIPKTVPCDNDNRGHVFTGYSATPTGMTTAHIDGIKSFGQGFDASGQDGSSSFTMLKRVFFFVQISLLPFGNLDVISAASDEQFQDRIVVISSDVTSTVNCADAQSSPIPKTVPCDNDNRGHVFTGYSAMPTGMTMAHIDDIKSFGQGFDASGQDGSSSFTMLKRVFFFVQISLLPFGNLDVISAASDEQFQDRIVVISSDVTSTVYCADAQSSPIPKTVPCDNDNRGHVFTGYSATPTGMTMAHIDGIKSFGQGFDASGQDGSSSFTMLKRVFFFVQISLLPFGNLDVISAASDEQFQDRIVVISSDVTSTVYCADAQSSPIPKTVPCDDNRGHVFTGYSATPTGMTMAHIDGIKSFGQGFDASGQDGSSSFTMLKRVFFFVQISLLPFGNLDVISAASDEQFQDRIVVISSDVTSTVYCADAQSSPIPKTVPCDNDNRGHVFTGYSATPTGMTMAHIDGIKSFGQGFDASGQDGSSSFTMLKRVFFFVQISLLPFGNLDVISAASDEQFQDRIVVISSDVTSTVYCADAQSSPIPKTVPCDDNRGHVFTGYSATPTGMTMAHIDGIKSFGQGFDASGQDGSSSFTMLKRVFFFVQISLLPFGNLDVISAASDEQFQDRIVVISSDVTSTVYCADAQSSPIPKTVPCDNDNRGHVFTGYSATPTGMTMAHIDGIKSFGQGFDASGQDGSSSFTMLKRVFFFVQISLLPFGNLDVISAASDEQFQDRIVVISSDVTSTVYCAHAQSSPIPKTVPCDDNRGHVFTGYSATPTGMTMAHIDGIKSFGQGFDASGQDGSSSFTMLKRVFFFVQISLLPFGNLDVISAASDEQFQDRIVVISSDVTSTVYCADAQSSPIPKTVPCDNDNRGHVFTGYSATPTGMTMAHIDGIKSFGQGFDASGQDGSSSFTMLKRVFFFVQISLLPFGNLDVISAASDEQFQDRIVVISSDVTSTVYCADAQSSPIPKTVPCDNDNRGHVFTGYSATPTGMTMAHIDGIKSFGQGFDASGQDGSSSFTMLKRVFFFVQISLLPFGNLDVISAASDEQFQDRIVVISSDVTSTVYCADAQSSPIPKTVPCDNDNRGHVFTGYSATPTGMTMAHIDGIKSFGQGFDASGQDGSSSFTMLKRVFFFVQISLLPFGNLDVISAASDEQFQDRIVVISSDVTSTVNCADAQSSPIPKTVPCDNDNRGHVFTGYSATPTGMTMAHIDGIKSFGQGFDASGQDGSSSFTMLKRVFFFVQISLLPFGNLDVISAASDEQFQDRIVVISSDVTSTVYCADAQSSPIPKTVPCDNDNRGHVFTGYSATPTGMTMAHIDGIKSFGQGFDASGQDGSSSFTMLKRVFFFVQISLLPFGNLDVISAASDEQFQDRIVVISSDVTSTVYCADAQSSPIPKTVPCDNDNRGHVFTGYSATPTGMTMAHIDGIKSFGQGFDASGQDGSSSFTMLKRVFFFVQISLLPFGNLDVISAASDEQFQDRIVTVPCDNDNRGHVFTGYSATPTGMTMAHIDGIKSFGQGFDASGQDGSSSFTMLKRVFFFVQISLLPFGNLDVISAASDEQFQDRIVVISSDVTSTVYCADAQSSPIPKTVPCDNDNRGHVFTGYSATPTGMTMAHIDGIKSFGQGFDASGQDGSSSFTMLKRVFFFVQISLLPFGNLDVISAASDEQFQDRIVVISSDVTSTVNCADAQSSPIPKTVPCDNDNRGHVFTGYSATPTGMTMAHIDGIKSFGQGFDASGQDGSSSFTMLKRVFFFVQISLLPFGNLDVISAASDEQFQDRIVVISSDVTSTVYCADAQSSPIPKTVPCDNDNRGHVFTGYSATPTGMTMAHIDGIKSFGQGFDASGQDGSSSFTMLKRVFFFVQISLLPFGNLDVISAASDEQFQDRIVVISSDVTSTVYCADAQSSPIPKTVPCDNDNRGHVFTGYSATPTGMTMAHIDGIKSFGQGFDASGQDGSSSFTMLKRVFFFVQISLLPFGNLDVISAASDEQFQDRIVVISSDVTSTVNCADAQSSPIPKTVPCDNDNRGHVFTGYSATPTGMTMAHIDGIKSFGQGFDASGQDGSSSFTMLKRVFFFVQISLLPFGNLDVISAASDEQFQDRIVVISSDVTSTVYCADAQSSPIPKTVPCDNDNRGHVFTGYSATPTGMTMAHIDGIKSFGQGFDASGQDGSSSFTMLKRVFFFVQISLLPFGNLDVISAASDEQFQDRIVVISSDVTSTVYCADAQSSPIPKTVPCDNDNRGHVFTGYSATPTGMTMAHIDGIKSFGQGFDASGQDGSSSFTMLKRVFFFVQISLLPFGNLDVISAASDEQFQDRIVVISSDVTSTVYCADAQSSPIPKTVPCDNDNRGHVFTGYSATPTGMTMAHIDGIKSFGQGFDASGQDGSSSFTMLKRVFFFVQISLLPFGNLDVISAASDEQFQDRIVVISSDVTSTVYCADAQSSPIPKTVPCDNDNRGHVFTGYSATPTGMTMAHIDGIKSFGQGFDASGQDGSSSFTMLKRVFFFVQISLLPFGNLDVISAASDEQFQDRIVVISSDVTSTVYCADAQSSPIPKTVPCDNDNRGHVFTGYSATPTGMTMAHIDGIKSFGQGFDASGQDGSSSFTMLKRVFFFVQISLLPFGNLDVISAASDEQFQDRIVVISSDVTSTVNCADAQSSPIPKTVPCDNDNRGHVFTGYSATPTGMTMAHIDGIKSFGQGFDASGQDGSSSFTMLKRVFFFVQISLLPFGNLDVISAASDEQFQDRIVVISSDVTSTVYCADAQSSPIPKTVPCDNDNRGHVFTGYSATPTGMTMAHIDGIKSFGQGFDASGQDGSSSFTMLKRVFFFVQISLLPFGNLDVISAASDEQFQDRIVVISSDVTSTVYCADAQSSPIPKTVPCDNDNRGHVFTGYSATPTGMTMAHIDGIKSFGQGFDASGQDGSSSFTMLKRVFFFVQISLLPFGNLDVISAASDEQFQDRIVVISSDVTSTVNCADAQSSPIPKTVPCDNDNRGHVFTGYSATPTGMTMAHIDGIKSFGQGFDASGQDGSSSFTMLKRVFFFVQISLLPFGNLDVISAASDEQFQDRIVVISSDVTSTVYCADAQSSPIPKTVPCDNDNRGHVFTGYSATPTGMTMAHIDGIKSFGQGFDASGQDGSSSFTMLKRVFFFVQISLLPFGNLDVISAASDEQFQDRIVVISSDVTSTVNCADAQSSPIPKTVPCDNDNRGHVFTGYSATPTGMTMAHIDGIKSFGQGFDASGQDGSSSFTMLKRVFFFVQISLLPFGNLDVISAASDEQFQDRIVVISSDVTSTVYCADAQSSPIPKTVPCDNDNRGHVFTGYSATPTGMTMAHIDGIKSFGQGFDASGQDGSSSFTMLKRVFFFVQISLLPFGNLDVISAASDEQFQDRIVVISSDVTSTVYCADAQSSPIPKTVPCDNDNRGHVFTGYSATPTGMTMAHIDGIKSFGQGFDASGQDGSSSFTMLKRVFFFVQISLLPFGNLDVISAASDEQFQDRIVVISSDVTSTVYCADAQSSPIPKTVPCDNDNRGHVFTGYSATPTGMTMAHIDGIKSFGQGFDASGQDGSSSFTMLKRVFFFVQISLLPFGNLDVISAASDEQFQDRIVVISSDVTSTVYCADAQSSPIPKTVPCDNDNRGHVFTGYSATPTGMTMAHIDGIKSFGQGFDASGQDGSSSFTMLKRVFFFVQISLLPFGNLDVISAASDEQFQDRIVVISSDVTSTVYCADAQSSPIPKTVPCDNDNRGHVFTGYSATPTGMTMAHIDGIKSFGQGFDASGQDGSSSFTMLKRVFFFVQISLLPFGNLDVISAASDEQFQDRIVVISSDVTSTVNCADAQSSPIPKTVPCDNDNRGHVFTGYSATPTGMTMAHIDGIKSFGQGFDASGQDGSSSFTMLKRVFFFVQISLLPFGNLDVISAASDEQFQDRIVVISSDVTSTVNCADAQSSPIPKTVPCDNDNRGHVFTGYSATPTGMTTAHIDGIKSFGQGFDASGQDGSSSFTMLKRVFFFVQISLLPFGNLDVISAASDEQFQDRIVVISSDVTSTVYCADAQSSPIPKTVPCDNDNRGHVFTGYSATPTGMTMAHIDGIKSFGQGFDASGQDGSSSFTMLKRVFFFVQISLLPFGNLDVISAASDEQFQDRIVVISSDVTSTVNCADAQSSPIPKTVPCDNDNRGHVFTGYSATPTGMTMAHIDGIKSFGQGFDASGQDGSSSFTMLKRVFFFVQISLLPFGNLDVISAASDEQFQDRIVVISSDVTSTVNCADAQSSPIPKTVPCDNDNRGHVFTGYSATPTGMTMAHIDGIKSFGQGFDASGQDGSSSFTMLKRVFFFVQISLLPFGNLDVISAASDEQFQDRIVVISSDVTSTVYCADAQSSPIPKTVPCDNDNRGHVFTGYSATPTGMTTAHIDGIKSFGQGFDASGQDGSSSFTMLKRVFFFVQISLLPFGNLDVISAASDEQFQDRIVVISSDVTSTVNCADAQSSPIPKTVPCDNDNRGHVFTGYSATPTGMTMAHIDGIKSFGQGFDASGQDGSSSFTMLKRVFFFVQISLLPFGNLDVISAASDEQFQDRIVVISSDVTSTVYCADAQSSPIPKTVPCDNDNRGHVFTGYSATPTGMTTAHIDGIKSFGQGFDASGQDGSSSFTMLKRVFFFVQISLLPFGNLDVISAASDEQFQDRIVVISSDVTSTVYCADAQSSPIPKTVPCDNDNRGHVFTGYSATPTGMTMAHIDGIKSFGQGFDASGQDGSSSFTMLKRVFFFVQISLLPFGNLDVISAASDEQFQDRIVVISSDVTSTVYCADAQSSPIPKTVPCDNDNRGHVFTGYSATPTGMTMAHIDGIKSFGQGFDASGQDGSSSFTMLKRVFFFVQISLLPFGNLDVISAASDEQFQDRIVVISSDVTSTVNCADAQSSPIPKTVPCDNDNRGHVFTGYSATPTGMTMAHIDGIKSFGQGFDASGQDGSSSFTMLKRVFFFVQISLLPFGNLDVISAASDEQFQDRIVVISSDVTSTVNCADAQSSPIPKTVPCDNDNRGHVFTGYSATPTGMTMAHIDGIKSFGQGFDASGQDGSSSFTMLKRVFFFVQISLLPFGNLDVISAASDEQFQDRIVVISSDVTSTVNCADAQSSPIPKTVPCDNDNRGHVFTGYSATPTGMTMAHIDGIKSFGQGFDASGQDGSSSFTMLKRVFFFVQISLLPFGNLDVISAASDEQFQDRIVVISSDVTSTVNCADAQSSPIPKTVPCDNDNRGHVFTGYSATPTGMTTAHIDGIKSFGQGFDASGQDGSSSFTMLKRVFFFVQISLLPFGNLDVISAASDEQFQDRIVVISSDVTSTVYCADAQSSPIPKTVPCDNDNRGHVFTGYSATPTGMTMAHIDGIKSFGQGFDASGQDGSSSFTMLKRVFFFVQISLLPFGNLDVISAASDEQFQDRIVVISSDVTSTVNCADAQSSPIPKTVPCDNDNRGHVFTGYSATPTGMTMAHIDGIKSFGQGFDASGQDGSSSFTMLKRVFFFVQISLLPFGNLDVISAASDEQFQDRIVVISSDVTSTVNCADAQSSPIPKTVPCDNDNRGHVFTGYSATPTGMTTAHIDGIKSFGQGFDASGQDGSSSFTMLKRVFFFVQISLLPFGNLDVISAASDEQFQDRIVVISSDVTSTVYCADAQSSPIPKTVPCDNDNRGHVFTGYSATPTGMTMAHIDGIKSFGQGFDASGQDGSSSFTMLKRVFFFVQISLLPFGNLDVISAASDEQFQDRIVVISSDVTSTVYCADAQSSPIPKTVPCDNDNRGHVFTGYSATPTGMTTAHIDGIKSFGQGFDASGQDGSSSFTMLKRVFFFVQISLLPFGNLDVISAASDEQFQDRIVVISSDVTSTVNCADAQSSPIPKTVPCDNDNRGHVFTGYSATPTGMTMAHIDGIKSFGQGFDASGQDGSSSFTMLKRVFFFVQISLLPFGNLDVISAASDEQFQDRIVVISSDVTSTVYCADAQSSPIPKTVPCDNDNRGHVFTGYSATPTGMTMAHIDGIKSFGQGFDASGQDGSSSFTMLKRVFFFVQISLLPFGNLDVISAASDEQFQDRIVVISSDVTSTVYCADAQSSPIPKTVPCDNDNRGHVFTGYSATPTGMTMAHIDGIKSFGQGFDASGQDGSSSFTMLKRVFFFVQISLLPFGNLDVISAASDEQFQDRIVVISSDVTSTVYCADAQSSPIPKTVPCDNDNRGHVFTGYSATPTGMTMAHIDGIKSFGQGFDASGQDGSSSFTMLKRVFFFVQISLLPFGNLDVISAASDEQFQDRIVVISSDVTSTVYCADAQSSPIPKTVPCDNDNRGHVFTGYSATPTGMTMAHIDGIKSFGQGFDASGQDGSSSFTMLKRVFFFVQISLLPFGNLDVISAASDEQFQDRIVESKWEIRVEREKRVQLEAQVGDMNKRAEADVVEMTREWESPDTYLTILDSKERWPRGGHGLTKWSSHCST